MSLPSASHEASVRSTRTNILILWDFIGVSSNREITSASAPKDVGSIAGILGAGLTGPRLIAAGAAVVGIRPVYA